MPRVTITKEQKRAAEEQKQFKDWSTMLAKGLVLYMWEEKLQKKDIAEKLGLSRNTINKLLDKNYDMQMPIETIWRLFDMAGIRMVRNEQEDA